ncbi:uncharacterized protein LOC125020234 isoform X2 [Mugil cephalus]|uniref:uncharacterized protein LOC125020234 isoform X2 n=1 Tax=Mugil cephalus TaxID=48193 RepID=UPI001FB6B2F9|nr:uncharacterized protein LOC125020234 isoform X2 [Mugil cephalus]
MEVTEDYRASVGMEAPAGMVEPEEESCACRGCHTCFPIGCCSGGVHEKSTFHFRCADQGSCGVAGRPMVTVDSGTGIGSGESAVTAGSQADALFRTGPKMMVSRSMEILPLSPWTLSARLAQLTQPEGEIKCVLVLHLISAAFATAALGLMSKHLPYRQDSYHCEHCHRLELHAVQHCFRKCTGQIEQKCKLLIDGILGTLVIFLVLELLICITAMLFGLSVLAAGGNQATSQRPLSPPTRPPPVSDVQAAATAIEPSQVAVVVTEPESEQVEDISTPPTEPQVEPIETVATEP